VDAAGATIHRCAPRPAPAKILSDRGCHRTTADGLQRPSGRVPADWGTPIHHHVAGFHDEPEDLGKAGFPAAPAGHPPKAITSRHPTGHPRTPRRETPHRSQPQPHQGSTPGDIPSPLCLLRQPDHPLPDGSVKGGPSARRYASAAAPPDIAARSQHRGRYRSRQEVG
jgi:hypothetical protein